MGEFHASCIEDDCGFKPGDHHERQAESDIGNCRRNGKPFLHRCDDEADSEKGDSSSKLRFISEMLRDGVVVFPDAVDAVDHGENSDADGNDFNNIRQLQHEQDCDEQFSQNHDDFIDVTIEHSGHVELPPVLELGSAFCDA